MNLSYDRLTAPLYRVFLISLVGIVFFLWTGIGSSQAQTVPPLPENDRPPTVTQDIGDFLLAPGGANVNIPLWQHFSDPDEGDRLTYTVVSDTPTVATASLDSSGLAVAITPIAVGSAQVTVTAADPDLDPTTAVSITSMVSITNLPIINTSNHPDYQDSAFRLEMLEGSALQTQLTTEPITATDPDVGESVTLSLAADPEFSLQATNNSSPFSLNEQGHLFNQGGLDLESFIGIGVEPLWTMFVVATDSNGATSRERVYITINDVAEPEPVAKISSGGLVAPLGEVLSIPLDRYFANTAHEDMRFGIQNNNTAVLTTAISANPATLEITYVAQGSTTIELCATALLSTGLETLETPFSDCDSQSDAASVTLEVTVTQAGTEFGICPTIYNDFLVDTNLRAGFPLGTATAADMLCLTFQSIFNLFYPRPTETVAQIAQHGIDAIRTQNYAVDTTNDPYQCLLFAAGMLDLCTELDGLDTTVIPDAVIVAVEAIVDSLGDRNTFYTPEDEAQAILQRFGIGAAGVGLDLLILRDTGPQSTESCDAIASDCELRVREVLAPHPAAIEADQPIPRDAVIAIDGVAVTDGQTLSELTRLINGDVDSRVDLTFRRTIPDAENEANEGNDGNIGNEEEETTREWTLPYFREVLELDSITQRSFDFQHPAVPSFTKVGYIYVSTFNDSTDEQFTAALSDLITEGITSLVVDLRSNGGGTVSSFLNIMGELMAPGLLFRASETNSGVTISGAPNRTGIAEDRSALPLTVITNQGSASASESMVAGLVVNRQAVHLGRTTFGKATTQTVQPLSPYGMPRFTIQESYGCAAVSRTTGCSREIRYSEIGIVPDRTIPITCASRGRLTLCNETTIQPFLAASVVVVDDVVITNTPANGANFAVGEQVRLEVRHSGAWEPSRKAEYTTLDVDLSGGSPTLGVQIGDQTRQAIYTDQIAGALRFEFTVQAGDADIDHMVIPTDGITLNGADIRRFSGWELAPIQSAIELDYGIGEGGSVPDNGNDNAANNNGDSNNAEPSSGLNPSPSSSSTLPPNSPSTQPSVPSSQPNTVGGFPSPGNSGNQGSQPTNPPSSPNRMGSADFQDIDENSHAENINRLASMGITHGCNPPSNTRFCPDRAVTRGEMATFMVRAFDISDTSDDLFGDDDGNTHEANINRLATAEITRGCNPPENSRYCPERSVTRAQMATFIARALDLAAGSGDFTDTADSVHQSDINRIASVGITQGCNPPTNSRYCPERPVTRAEMATFLIRATDLES